MSDMKQIFGSDSENEEHNEEEQEAHEETEEVQAEEHEEEEHGEESEVKEQEEEEAEEPQEAGSPAAENAGEEEEHHTESNEEEHEEQQEEHEEDDDEVVRPKKDEKTAEVFGDELADLSDDDSINDADDDNNLRASQNQEDQEETEPEQVIDIDIPRVKTDLGKEINFVKLPNFLSVEPRPFDPEHYVDELPKGEALLDEEGKTRVRLKVENTIRWRYEKDEEGNLVKQSNAKIVKWSDGSLSLHLGNEIFDVSKLAMHGDHNHLFVRQGNVLQGQAVFRTKLSFRPHSTDSMTHRKMTMSLVDSGSKTKKVKILSEAKDNPEKNRLELIKKEEEKLRAASRRQNQQRRIREKSHQKGLSANYLEDRYNSDDDDAGISLSAIKNRFKNRNDTIDSSSDESDRERRLTKAKNDDDDEIDDEYGDDDDDMGSSKPAHAPAQKKKKKMVVSDDED